MKNRTLNNLIPVFICAIIIALIVGALWGTMEMSAYYHERQYLFEWELQQKTIKGLLNATEVLIERTIDNIKK